MPNKYKIEHNKTLNGNINNILISDEKCKAVDIPEEKCNGVCDDTCKDEEEKCSSVCDEDCKDDAISKEKCEVVCVEANGHYNGDDHHHDKHHHHHHHHHHALSEENNKGKGCHQGRWGKLLYEYALDSSFHGPKQIVEDQPWTFRRLVWLIIFLAGTGIFLYQAIISIERYYTYPVSVNVKINYNTSIAFPAVTVCNTNAFRATRAYALGYYDMISDVYGDPTFTNFSIYGNTPDLDSLYIKTGHSLDDLIVSCTWNGANCNIITDFTQTMTEYGLCYTFNGVDNPNGIKHARQTGINGGLSLKMNIEQYEYMIGPNGGAGLKVLIHTPIDRPLVRDHGLSLPPGSHGFIGLKTYEVTNLLPKYGKCNDTVKLQYFEDYTVSNCYTNCKERHMYKTCGCRDINMPAKKGIPPVCNVNIVNTCMRKSCDDFNTKVMPLCQKECPISCQSTLHEKSVSYASISNFDIQGLLQGHVNDSLGTKYLAANEVNQRVNKVIIAEDTQLISNLESITEKLSGDFKQIESHLNACLKTLQTSYNKLQQRINFHLNQGLTCVKYISTHDFLRGWNVYKERSFHYVTLDFMDFPSSLLKVVFNANQTISFTNRTTRQLLYSPIEAMFGGRKDLLERATSYINETNKAYSTGAPLLNYHRTPVARYDNSCISLPLLHVGIAYQAVNYDAIMVGIHNMTAGLDALMQIGTEFVQRGTFNESYFWYANDRFIHGGKTFNYRLFMLDSVVINPPETTINKKITDFERINRTLNRYQSDTLWKIGQIQNILDNFHNDWKYILHVTNLSSDYLANVSLKKLPLSKEVTSANMTHSISLASIFFQNIRSRERELYDLMITLSGVYADVWRTMMNEVYTENFYHMIYNDSETFLNSPDKTEVDYLLNIFALITGIDNNTLKMMNPEDVVDLINGDFYGTNVTAFIDKLHNHFANLSNSLNVASLLGDSDSVFLNSMENYRTSMRNFIHGNRIDARFFKENFMTLDIFMEQLSYEAITQQKAYDITQMLSDIGGSLGLFIGGSVISALELFDIFIHNGLRIAFNR